MTKELLVSEVNTLNRLERDDLRKTSQKEVQVADAN